MKYKEFVRWCNDRACDGCWGPLTAAICIDIIQEMDEVPFWKREKIWRAHHLENAKRIVDAINKTIDEFEEKYKERGDSDERSE